MKIEETLLADTAKISQKYDAQRKASGENFNIFKILNLRTNEVRTHSAFIAELLSKEGSHDMQALFLFEFLRIVQPPVNFDVNDYSVEIEKHVGFISDNFDEGGRIDIILTDCRGNCVIVENKIYAGDQHKQLKRYYNFNKNAKILYLTLFGTPPSANSLDGIPASIVKPISYQNHILAWLEKCKDLAQNHNILRESLSQYIYLIRELTNQTLDHNMEQELFSLISKDESALNSALKIRNAFNSLMNKMHRDFVEAMRVRNKHLYENFAIGEYNFVLQQNEDADGLWIGIYPSFQGQGGQISNDPILLKIGNTIKEQFPDSLFNSSWYWLTPLGKRKEYEALEVEERLRIYNDKNVLNEYLEKIHFVSETYLTAGKKIIMEAMAAHQHSA